MSLSTQVILRNYIGNFKRLMAEKEEKLLLNFLGRINK